MRSHSLRLIRATSTTAVLLGLTGPAGYAQCPEWSEEFAREGVDSTIQALEEFQGVLYLAGRFGQTGNGPADNLATWDGERFAPLAPGITFSSSGPPVLDMIVFDDGSEEALYLTGNIEEVGGVPANDLARWDGASWSTVGYVSFLFEPRTLAVFDDGTGPDLYVGGEKSLSLSGAVYKLEDDVMIDTGICGKVRDLAVFDDGSGPALYAAGSFAGTGNCNVSQIGLQRWDGDSWSLMASGPDGWVEHLAVSGSGDELWAAGNFQTAAGVNTGSLARWDGTQWSSVGGVYPGTGIRAIRHYDDGTGEALYVWDYDIERWDGTSWTTAATLAPYTTYIRDVPSDFAVYDDGNGASLYLGGYFDQVDGDLARNIARIDAGGAHPVGGGQGIDASVYEVFAMDDGTGEAVYAAGLFELAGTADVKNIARWDGSSWSALAGGLSSWVYELEAFDFGSGPELVAGGNFNTSAGIPMRNIARWNGSAWAAIDVGMNAPVWALEGFDPGGGEILYAGGEFSKAGGAPASRFAAWDGTSWSTPLSADAAVIDLLVWDDGSGPALYLGGLFGTVSGVATSFVAKWDGTTVSPLGGGLAGAAPLSQVYDLEVFDDGSGPALFAAGDFDTAGGAPASNVAKWDGTSWTPLGAGVSDTVRDLHTYDDGTGARLFAGGDFLSAGGQAVERIASWDGTTWTPEGGATDQVRDFATFADGSAPWPSLYVGGLFTGGSGTGMFHVGRRANPCAGESTSYCTSGTSASGCSALMSSTGTASATAASGFVITASAVEGDKTGLFFYGTNGRQANPWGSGTSYVCVIPPRWRGGLLSGGGTQGSCDGTFTQDLNARWCSTCPKPAHNPGPGSTVQAQLWYRDPQNTANLNSSMSDAIEFRVAP